MLKEMSCQIGRAYATVSYFPLMAAKIIGTGVGETQGQTKYVQDLFDQINVIRKKKMANNLSTINNALNEISPNKILIDTILGEIYFFHAAILSPISDVLKPGHGSGCERNCMTFAAKTYATLRKEKKMPPHIAVIFAIIAVQAKCTAILEGLQESILADEKSGINPRMAGSNTMLFLFYIRNPDRKIDERIDEIVLKEMLEQYGDSDKWDRLDVKVAFRTAKNTRKLLQMLINKYFV